MLSVGKFSAKEVPIGQWSEPMRFQSRQTYLCRRVGVFCAVAHMCTWVTICLIQGWYWQALSVLMEWYENKSSGRDYLCHQERMLVVYQPGWDVWPFVLLSIDHLVFVLLINLPNVSVSTSTYYIRLYVRIILLYYSTIYFEGKKIKIYLNN